MRAFRRRPRATESVGQRQPCVSSTSSSTRGSCCSASARRWPRVRGCRCSSVATRRTGTAVSVPRRLGRAPAPVSPEFDYRWSTRKVSDTQRALARLMGRAADVGSLPRLDRTLGLLRPVPNRDAEQFPEHVLRLLRMQAHARPFLGTQDSGRAAVAEASSGCRSTYLSLPVCRASQESKRVGPHRSRR